MTKLFDVKIPYMTKKIEKNVLRQIIFFCKLFYKKKQSFCVSYSLQPSIRDKYLPNSHAVLKIKLKLVPPFLAPPLSMVLTTLCFQLMEPFDMQFDIHLFLQTVTVIGRNKSRDSFYPISVAACKNKWISNYKSKGSIWSQARQHHMPQSSLGNRLAHCIYIIFLKYSLD